MSLTRLKLTNFKCFESLDIHFTDIVLLTGANSSGKSSVINALLAVLQTPDFPFSFSLNGNYVSMGDYDEVVFAHESDRGIGILLEFNPPNGPIVLESRFTKNKRTRAPRLESFSYTSGYLKLLVERAGARYKAQYKCDPSNHPHAKRPEMRKAFSRMIKVVIDSAIFEPKSGKRSNDSINIKSKNIEEGIDLMWDERLESSFSFKNLEDFQAKINKEPIFALLGLLPFDNKMASLVRNFSYVSPFRIAPDRTYYRKGREKDSLRVDRYGTNAVDQLADWAATRSRLWSQLEGHLRKLKLLDKLSIKNLDGGRFEVRVNILPKSVSSSLVDVGFGISQFLPILIADMQLGQNGTLMISQPEIHLHPSTQAEYAEFVAGRAKDGRRYVLETHSEYIINRLRLKIVRGEFDSTRATLYYFEQAPDGGKCTLIHMKKDGSLENAPSSFFATYLMDTMDMAIASTE